jgi:hypothetical protein
MIFQKLPEGFMARLYLYLLVSFFAVLPTSSFAGGEALFGLTFGASSEQVKMTVPAMALTQREGIFSYYRTADVPKGLSNVDFYQLIFANDKLVKVYAASKDVTNDVYGNEGKKRFADLRSALIAKYGKPATELQDTGMKLYKDAEEFYQCLNYTGCGLWVSIFHAPGKKILVQLHGTSRGRGWIAVMAESDPEWPNAVELDSKRTNASDKNAL